MPTKLSIITVNLNNAAGLQKTMQSVFTQHFKSFEYIIIDGGSTDESKLLIEANQDKLSYSLSEKDNGIYNAMNKGISKATGDYLLFLNSGDFLYNESVIENVFLEGYEFDLIYGDILWQQDGIYSKGSYPDKLTFEYFMHHSLPHQGTFIRRTLFNSVGLYDEDGRISSDWSFFLLAIYKYNCSYKHLSQFIAICDRHGLSCDTANYPKIAFEREEVIQKHFSSFLQDYNNLLDLKNEFQILKRRLGYRVYNKLKKYYHKQF